MKQIFDWLREQIENKSNYEPVDYDYYDMACSGEQGFIAREDALDAINEAEAKWEAEHKSYDVEKVLEQIHDYFCKVIDECEGNEVPHEILAYNKAICEIVRKGEVE